MDPPPPPRSVASPTPSKRSEHLRSAPLSPPGSRSHSSHAVHRAPAGNAFAEELERLSGRLAGASSSAAPTPPPRIPESEEGSWYKHDSMESGDSADKGHNIGSKHSSLLHQATRRRPEEAPKPKPAVPRSVPPKTTSSNDPVPGTISVEPANPTDRPVTGEKRRNGKQPRSRPSTRPSTQKTSKSRINTGAGDDHVQEDLTALPPPIERNKETSLRQDFSSTTTSGPRLAGQTSSTFTQSTMSRAATELYTISWLIFFAIWGTLARLGLQWLTFYPGAPVVLGVLWANFAGSLVLGFLAEDQQLFREEWGELESDVQLQKLSQMDSVQAKARHLQVKKTIPLYIGLATGFCGSFTSFSSFMRDVFFALSNNLPSPVNHPSESPISPSSATVPRNGGYSVMAVLAVVILTTTVCIGALKAGTHLAILVDRLTPTLPSALLRRVLDNAAVLLGWGSWIGAIILAILPPDESWRGEALFACVFAPAGCLLRYYVSQLLNGVVPSFPLGTFAVNMFGTAVLGMAFDLQHIRIAGSEVGGGRVACQVLQGLMDGFDGCLTTVSTWVAELVALRRGQAYVYGSMSVAVGLGLLVMIMGSVRWTVGFQTPVCVVG